MRLHSNVITESDIRNTLRAEQDEGRIARSVGFRVLTQHKSQSHKRAFEVGLNAWDDGTPGRRQAAWGNEGYAATYDEWGWLMGALYQQSDPFAVWGSAKHPTYADAEHFDEVTGMTYNPDKLLSILENGIDPYPYVAPGSSRVGRYGANRHDEQITPWGVPYYLHAPRTAEWVRQFAHLTNEPAHV
jgi:hypothetical protein